MPSKTPIVIPTLNKASGSKLVKGHKHVKLTFVLSQGFFCEKQSSAAKYQYGRAETLWVTCSWRLMAGTESILWTKGTKFSSGITLSRKFTPPALLHRPPWLLPRLARRVWEKTDGLCRTGAVFDPWQLLVLIKISLNRSCSKYPLFERRATLKGGRLCSGSHGGGRVKTVIPKSTSRGVIQISLS